MSFTKTRSKRLVCGFIGNFVPYFSTENERKLAFEELGHEVIPFQENKTTAEMLREAIPNLDLLVYSHTHDPAYVIKDLRKVFEEYKKAGVPTASAHLDRWLWLDREKDMGNEATWFTEYIFMADGSPEAAEKYDSMGLNWHWLKPGVSRKDCYMAAPDRDRFPHDVIFVGSRGYHPEYQFRPKLIDWLKETYGDRFGHYGNDGIGVMRGDDLNVLYASAKVAVGDSCFGGRPGYWSDRVAETTGRGGFLLHPDNIEKDDDPNGTIDNPWVIKHPKGNLDYLKKAIDHFLKNEAQRESFRKDGYEWTKENATYTHRAKEMLEVMGLTWKT